ncbi:MAG: glyoxalase/bleomycin resistance/extradiol dioxygenase family protein [Winogradskyella sp.]|uniref:glyoxalase/bleomycin resistance/extradiol dioxygenase family protein n=1 Tax=Winogradskyella sp. TaxID=1883156 RepID=UPI00181C9B55|nr:glyoxalase/bleomycin resistance/extradiol dioxygenase family protein [Winogradskyella sp.]
MSTPSPLAIIPVLSSMDIERDVLWHNRFTGFNYVFGDSNYCGLQRDGHEVHLQFHHGTEDDPVYGSVIKLFVKNIDPYIKEFEERGTITEEKVKKNTAWGTHEFGFLDLNKNAIYLVQDIL